MQTTPMASVIMPVYNQEKYISATIESILNQTYTNFEFIIADDCSTDNGPNIIQQYAQQDHRIKYFRNTTNLKIAKTLNVAIKQATAPYIIRMDADDIAVPHRFNTQIEFMEHHLNVGVCGSWAKHFNHIPADSFKNLTFMTNAQQLKIKMYLFSNEILHPAVIMRKSYFDQGVKYNEDPDNHSEDWALWVHLLNIGATITNLPEYLLYYRASATQLTQINSINIDQANNKIITNNLLQLFKHDMNQSIIDTHLKFMAYLSHNLVTEECQQYLQHIELLKCLNIKYQHFETNIFNNLLDQYLIKQ